MFKKGDVPWNKGKMGISGKDHHNYKNGLYSKYDPPKNRLELLNKRQLVYRHENGISEIYSGARTCEEKMKFQKLNRKLHRKAYKYRQKKAGPLLKRTIQLVYEDNIKKYGTLTCYLCLNPILFGNDSLEHMLPLSRGGTNEYNNLAIACFSCNSKKHARTLDEYMAIQKRRK